VVSATLPIEAVPVSEAAMLADLKQAVEFLRGVVRLPVPGALSGRAAQEFVTLFSEAERAAASGVALFTPKVVETGEYTRGGHGSAADWLGSLSGSSSGAAKGRLAAAARAARDPRIDLLSGSGGFGSGGGDDEDGDDGDEGGPDRGGGQGRGRGPLARTLIIVNAESLRRGTTAGDELCEIEGIGPVSVAAATELLSTIWCGCAPSATGSRPMEAGVSKAGPVRGNGSHLRNPRALSRSHRPARSPWPRARRS
jgi:hypothetical protein